ncbi:MAG: divalent-cation tolerance protein CutA [Pseudanabaenaceae cyanobacterium bins.39]|nr:divalent-cation tolerance protein CutA [Pseudanabaenaceae cyanobacterium bins.39]
MTTSEVSFIVMMTTLPNFGDANQIAKTLVEEKLAACVQILPSMLSTYIWEDQVCQSNEHLLLIKTLEVNCEIVMERLRTLHHYDTPEIISLPIMAIAPNYGDWIWNICSKAAR